MVDSERQILNNYYENLRVLLQIVERYQSGFEDVFIENRKADYIIKNSVCKALRTIRIDLFSALDLIGNILNTEDEFELQELLEKQELFKGVS